LEAVRDMLVDVTLASAGPRASVQYTLESEYMSTPEPIPPEQATDPLILSLDIGTSSVRALGYDALARPVDGWEVHLPYSVTTTPDGGVTIDADALADLAVASVDDILARARAAKRSIAAVACDTFWHSLLATDAQGRTLTPVLTWADTRSAPDAAELKDDLDEHAMHKRTGAFLHSSYPPAKLRWFSRTNRKVFDQATYWMTLGEFLYLRLFGERRVSISMASGSGLFEQNRCDWDREMLNCLGVRRDQLSPISEFNETMSQLLPAYAERWPELRHTPWFLALGDGACSNVGAGGFCDEVAVVMVGTSGAIRVVREADATDIPDKLWTYRVDRRRLVQGGALSAGGNIFAWASRTLRVADPKAAEAHVLVSAPDSHGLTVLPFLAGERSPDWNVNARSAIVGMTLNTSPGDMLQALLESVAYRFGAVHDLVLTSIPSVRVIIGSGAGLIHSPAWMQLMTDVFGHSMVTSAVSEASSRGAALLALEALGALPDAGAVAAPLGATHEPRWDYTSVYRRAMKRQDDLYGKLMNFEP
jgi:gluconokinase